jgi:hypothetical protein
LNNTLLDGESYIPKLESNQAKSLLSQQNLLNAKRAARLAGFYQPTKQ